MATPSPAPRRASIEVPRNLRRYCEERSRVEVEGDSIYAALEDLVRRHPELESRIFDERRELLSHLVVLRVDEVLRRDALRSTPLEQGEVLRRYAAVAGGSQRPEAYHFEPALRRKKGRSR
jgi:hypothetical protein